MFVKRISLIKKSILAVTACIFCSSAFSMVPYNNGTQGMNNMPMQQQVFVPNIQGVQQQQQSITNFLNGDSNLTEAQYNQIFYNTNSDKLKLKLKEAWLQKNAENRSFFYKLVSLPTVSFISGFFASSLPTFVTSSLFCIIKKRLNNENILLPLEIVTHHFLNKKTSFIMRKAMAEDSSVRNNFFYTFGRGTGFVFGLVGMELLKDKATNFFSKKKLQIEKPEIKTNEPIDRETKTETTKEDKYLNLPIADYTPAGYTMNFGSYFSDKWKKCTGFVNNLLKMRKKAATQWLPSK